LCRIRGVNEKIASFFLRDLATIYAQNAAIAIRNEQAYLLQPVDTWVKRVVRKVGQAHVQNMHNREIASYLMSESLNSNLNPQHVNMGIWFFGAQVAQSEYRLRVALDSIEDAQQLMNYYQEGLRNAVPECI
jgi:endonuclease III